MTNLTSTGAPVASCNLEDSCEITQCEVCLAEVPGSVARHVEGVDYVHHFCGLECMGIWRARQEHPAAG